MISRTGVPGRTGLALASSALIVASLFAVAAFQLPSCFAPPGGGGSEVKTTYSGRGTAIRVTTPNGDSVIADTGELSSDGGALEASSLEIDVAGLLTADGLHSTSVGGNGVASTESSLANLQVTVADHTLTADFLMSRADASCVDGVPQVTNSFEIANLVLDGQVLTVTTGRNQEFEIHDASGALIGRVVVNASDTSTNDTRGDSTVDALTVDVFNVLTLTLFHAHADIDCGRSEPGGDYLTGGGQIVGTPTGTRAVFAVAGGMLNNVLWGHLNYVDKAGNLHVKATSITAYEVVDAKTRRIRGNAEINGQGGFTFTVEAADNGEPGTSDTFSIALSNGYQAAGPLTNGNIQLHDLGE